jgi:hypothetical protein
MRNVFVICAVVSVLLSLTGKVQAAPVTLADSVVEFSGTQGQNGWYYGSCPAFDTADFVQMSWYDGDSWYGVESFSTPYLNSTGGYPGMDSADWAVRRWVSDYTGQIHITGDFRDLDTMAGDGANVRILLNETEIYSYLNIPSIAADYEVSAYVEAGDIIDFAIDPVSDTIFDNTRFTSVIVTPEPCTILLLGFGGLVLRKKSRA